MAQCLSPQILYTTFVAAAVAELYFFMMKRSSLEISRAAQIDPREGRSMLPLWYIWLWPIRLIKWGAALAIAMTIHWGLALILLAIPFAISFVIPIPHRHFIAFFRRKVRNDVARGENPEFSGMLSELLDRAEAMLAGR